MNEIKQMKFVVVIAIGICAVLLAMQSFGLFLVLVGGVVAIEAWDRWKNRK